MARTSFVLVPPVPPSISPRSKVSVVPAAVAPVIALPVPEKANYTNRLTGTEEGLVGYWPLKDSLISPIDTGPFNLDNPIIHPTYMEAF